MKTIFLFLKTTVLLVIGMCLLSVNGGDAAPNFKVDPALKVARLIEKQPQHILFLHFDRHEFLAGDTLWFKAYLASASNHVPLPDKQRINIELIDVLSQVVRVVFVQAENGLAKGYIGLPAELPGGNYLVRAYTDWMKNFDSELYFSREIFVVNPAEAQYSHPRQLRINRSFNKRLDHLINQWQLEFFPEGGQLIKGIENRIAFRATDGMGNDIEVSGEILGSDRKVITSFETEFPGYGDFILNPVSHRGYYANVRNAEGQKQRIALPLQLQMGYALSVSIENEQVIVAARTHPENQFNKAPYFLLGLSGQGVVYLQEVVFNDGIFHASLHLGELPTGILHWVLLDASLKPLAERAQFVNNLDFSVVEMEVFQLAVQPEEGFEVNINIDVGSQFQEYGNFSLAVTSIEPESIVRLNASNIVSEFLLSGNLRQQTYGVWDYLIANTSANRRKLDLIMLTNSWSRLDANAIAAQQLPDFEFQPTAYFTIKGQIIVPEGRSLRSPADVRLRLQGDLPRQFSTTSGKDGTFAFFNVSLSDVVVAEINASARNLPGGVQIRLNPITAKNVDFPISPLTRPHDAVTGSRRPTDRLQKDYSLLPLVRLTRQQADEGSSLATPDQVIFIDDLISQQFRTVFDVLRTHASGLNVSSGRVLLRGPTTIRGTSEPMFGIDGMFTGRDHLLNMRTSDVDRIEIFKGPSASIFGVRGANGVIMVRSRTGASQLNVSATYQITGFQPQRLFTLPTVQAGAESPIAENTLMWLPDVKPDSNGVASLWVRFPSKPNHIRLVFQGIDPQGNLYYGEEIVQF